MIFHDNNIAQIAAGDRDAFERLHTLLYDRLFFYAYKILGAVGESEDLVQETFMHYWVHRNDFKQLVAVKVYLYSTLNFKIRNCLRKQHRHSRLLNVMPVEPELSYEQLVISAEISGLVRQAIGELPPQTRRVLEYSLLDMSQEEIATHMDISINTVKSLKKGGYRALRESLSHLKQVLPLLFHI